MPTGKTPKWMGKTTKLVVETPKRMGKTPNPVGKTPKRIAFAPNPTALEPKFLAFWWFFHENHASSRRLITRAPAPLTGTDLAPTLCPVAYLNPRLGMKTK